MTGFNHAVTGALVAVAIDNPWIALPAAFASHFVIDMLPHWNYKVGSPSIRRLVIGSDIIISSILVMLLAVILPASPWRVLLGGLLGILPDTMWLPYILHGDKSPSNKKSPLHLVRRWHLKIQWSETSAGLIFEIFWFFFIFFLLIQVI